MTKTALIISLDITIIVFLLVVQTVISNRLSTGGLMLEKIEDQIHSYSVENAILGEKVADASSLTQILAKADKLNFVESKTAFVLTKSQPLALKP